MITPQELGLPVEKWYPHQEQTITRIVDAFNSGKKFVVLDAPTGSGKSVIAMAVGAMLGDRMIITTSTKQLQQQYADKFDIPVLKGKSNFTCPLYHVNAGDAPCNAGHECENKMAICPYYLSKAEAAVSPAVITNLAYLLNELRWVGYMKSKHELLVVDEAQLLDSAMASFVQLSISKQQLKKWIGETRVPEIDTPRQMLEWGLKLRNRLSLEIDTITSTDTEAVRRYVQLIHAWEAVDYIVDELMRTPKRYIIDRNDKRITVRPLWFDKEANTFLFTHYKKVLLMSATIGDVQRFVKPLGIDISDVEYIDVPSVFPKERRPILVIPAFRVNKAFFDNPKAVSEWVEFIDEIIDMNPDEKGVIHTSSFDQVRAITRLSRHRSRMVTHDPMVYGGRNYVDKETAVQKFTASDAPLILVSPSSHEGLDLPGKLGRWQIIAKVPFLDLGDKYTLLRAQADNLWSLWMVANRVVQASGRIVRSQDDFGITYIIDSNIVWLLSQHNSFFPRWWKEAVVPVPARGVARDTTLLLVRELTKHYKESSK